MQIGLLIGAALAILAAFGVGVVLVSFKKKKKNGVVAGIALVLVFGFLFMLIRYISINIHCC